MTTGSIIITSLTLRLGSHKEGMKKAGEKSPAATQIIQFIYKHTLARETLSKAIDFEITMALGSSIE